MHAATHVRLAVALVALCAGAGAAVAGAPAEAAACPRGQVGMEVLGVMPMEEGQAVVLRHPAERLLLPIWIGPAEAFAIQLRLDRKRFQRPLTHDLLDAAVQQLGGRLTRVQVDDLKDSTFVGTVFLKQGKRVHALDARPSDAIALAIGARAPICVAQKVLERAGIRDKDAAGSRPQGEGGAQPPAAQPARPAPEDELREALDAQPADKSL